MKFKKSRIAVAVSAASGSALLALTFAPLPALAQASADSQRLERVEITGSLIRRIEGETALPVVTLSAQELERAGATNAEQAVKLITQQQGGVVSSGSVSSGNGAAAYANLRNIGPQRTLILLNGKRIVNNPFSTVAVDLNTLPMAAIDRVETLADGASSIYGTDAIGGVINFITRKTYRGLSASAQMQSPTGPGADLVTGTLLAGFGDLAKQGFNAYVGINMRKQDPLLGTARDFMETSYIPERGFNGTSPTTFPANYSQVVNGRTVVPVANPTFPNCDPPLSIAVVGVNNQCNADTQGFTWVIPKQEQTSAFARGSMALGQNHTASIEYFVSKNIIDSRLAPSPENGLTMPANSPFFPGNGIYTADSRLDRTQPITVNWRTNVLGARAQETENTTQRAIASLEGTLIGWDYQAAGIWSKSEITQNFNGGYGNRAALVNGIRGSNGAPFLNPFGNQTAAGLAYLQANTVTGELQRGNGEMQSLNGVMSRQFGALPGGPMSLALAAEYRKEDMEYLTDVAKASQTSSSGLAGSAPRRAGDRNVWAVSAEMNFPILKGLDVNAAVRHDDYSDFGGTTNPKISIRYQPVDSLLMRASYNTGFAAPSLTQLYAPNATTFTSTRYNDPILCPGGTVNAAAGGIQPRDCGIQFQQLTGGNAGLQPEKSDAWTAGFVLQPTANFSFGMDYWYYNVKNSISTIGETAIFADPAKYANLFVRCSQAPAERRALIPGCQTPGGDPLAYIINTNLNLGDLRTSGIDLQLNWATGATAYGRFNFGLRGSYVDKYEFQVEPKGRWFNPVGQFIGQFNSSSGTASAGGAVFRYTQITTVNWTAGNWGATVTHRWTTGYRDQNICCAAPFNANVVGDYKIVDFGASYTGFRNLTLSFGMLNVFDKDPPFTNQVSRFQARAYDDRYHNPIGRTYTVGAKYEFK